MEKEAPLTILDREEAITILSSLSERLYNIAERADPEADIVALSDISELVDIGNTVKQLNRDATLQAILNGVMTRKRAAEIMNVHPLTISRWLTAATVEASEASDRNYPPVT